MIAAYLRMRVPYSLPDPPAAVTAHTLQLDDFLMNTDISLDIKRWKVIKGAFVSAWVVGLAAYAIHSGAEPTATALLAIATIALLNGVEASELVAVWKREEPAEQPREQDD